MGFTVTLAAELSKDHDFIAYARLLRQQGKDLANLPRVPDPGNPGHRWVYVWDSLTEAEKFAADLKKQNRKLNWLVVETTAPPSQGPFGPVLIQLARRGDGLLFALHPLSRAMIQQAFPDARPTTREFFTETDTWKHYPQKLGTLDDLVKEVIPSFTGLNLKVINDLGYAVIDAEDDRTWIYVPPKIAA